MKIAILYICTGRYIRFWEEFYEKTEKFFLTSYHKEYFVFTDQAVAPINERIHPIKQKQLGWPYDTLMRFAMFRKVEDQLSSFNYIFFLNANMRFLQPVNEEVLPSEKEGGLVAVKHPGFFDKTNEAFTYERDPRSEAYIPEGNGQHYFMGGFNGGTSEAYLQLIKDLDRNIKKDLRKNIVAIWHDESHLNKYLLDHKCKVLDSSFGYPENWDLPLERKVMILDKSRLGGHSFLREKKISIFEKAIRKLGLARW